MKKGLWILIVIMFFALLTPCLSAPFKVYPGARLENVYETKQPEAPGKMAAAAKVKRITFTTNDPFETVVAFYRTAAREYRTPGGGKPIRLSSGQELKEAYFILDGANDLSTSEHWIKIQRPYIDRDQTRGASYGKYEQAKEVTAIIEEEKGSSP